jgi:hypothetical protein
MAGVVKKRFNLTTVQVVMRDDDGSEINLGSVEQVTVTISQTTSTAHEGGKKLPDEIVDGIISIKGSIERAMTDFNVMNTLIKKKGENPYFDLIGTEQISGKTASVFNCKISGDIDALNTGLSDYTKQTISFEALDYDFQN